RFSASSRRSRLALVLEFEVPCIGSRRPDLIVLENGIVLVVDFKNRGAAEAADIDHALGHAHELADYNAGCPDRQLVPVLVPIGLDREPSESASQFSLTTGAVGSIKSHPKIGADKMPTIADQLIERLKQGHDWKPNRDELRGFLQELFGERYHQSD